jgi:hypothetical protein
MQAKQARKRWTCSESARLSGTDGARQEVIGDQLLVTPAVAYRQDDLLRWTPASAPGALLSPPPMLFEGSA